MISRQQIQRVHDGLPSGPREERTASLLRAAVRRCAAARGLDPRRARLRMFAGRAADADADLYVHAALSSLLAEVGAPLEPALIGNLYEMATALDGGRKQRGVFFTPPELTRAVAERALEPLAGRKKALRVCDPAVGGGAFLLEVLRQLGGSKRETASACVYGIDRSELAIAVAEACVWLEVGDPEWDAAELGQHLIARNALSDFDWERDFDLVIGNPPWVAYAGRAAQPLEPQERAFYAERYRAFSGYPTLHGMFVERAAKLAPEGVIALLLPSPIADLAGYAPVRRALTQTHRVREPLLELGQDAFEGVTQPCFILVAEPAAESVPDDREWRLAERQRRVSDAEELAPPEVLARIGAGPSFPRELFGEMGFQSSGQVSKTLFLRAPEPDARHVYPLLEGKDVSEFSQRAPRLFLNPDPEALKRARCRLRPAEDYRRAKFVVRQTASMPIAALHSGLPFRNTLLAGFAHDELGAETMVALLNSTLYRALHVARRRDARQAAFPQVKIAHLRALPRPPADPPRLQALVALTERATAEGVSAELRDELDRVVFELFDLGSTERETVSRFLESR